MSDALAPGYAGVASEDVVGPRGCRGCLADGHAQNHRVPSGEPGAGQLRAGHTSNALGRPYGSRNNTTIAATR
jgi:hypothetical protein